MVIHTGRQEDAKYAKKRGRCKKKRRETKMESAEVSDTKLQWARQEVEVLPIAANQNAACIEVEDIRSIAPRILFGFQIST